MVLNRIKLPNGLSVAIQHWKKPSTNHVDFTKRIICLHGWLDNSNSFSYLGPMLAEQGFEVVAMDLVGHGNMKLIVYRSYLIISVFFNFSSFMYVSLSLSISQK